MDEATFDKIDEIIGNVQAKAPDEIKDDVATVAKNFQDVRAIFAQYDFDIAKLTSAATADPALTDKLQALNSDEFNAASQRVNTYLQEKCGIQRAAPEPHHPPRWMISPGARRRRPAERPGRPGPASAGQPRAMAPSSSRCAGTPSAARSSSSPWKTPKNSAPRPASSAASSRVMTAKAVSTVQYGTGQASADRPSPVAALSGSP